jgi:hypothetical protein
MVGQANWTLAEEPDTECGRTVPQRPARAAREERTAAALRQRDMVRASLLLLPSDGEASRSRAW